MKFDRKKTLLLAFTSLLFLAGTVLLIWRIVAASQEGWAGIAFWPGAKPESEKDVKPRLFARKPGAVLTIVSGGPADKAGIQVGDVVLDINGIPTYETERLAEIAARVKPGDTLTYQIRRGDKELSVPLRLETLLKVEAIGLSTEVFIALIFFVIGFFVFWKKPEDRRALIFYLMSVAAAMFFMMSAASGITLSRIEALGSPGATLQFREEQLFMIGTFVFAWAFTPLLLHFALVFPKERPVLKDHPYILRWVYGLPAVPMLLILALTLLALFEGASLVIGLPVLISLLVLVILFVSRLQQVVRNEGWKVGLFSHPFKTMTAFILTTCLVAIGSIVLARALQLPNILISITLLFSLLIVASHGLLYPILTCVALVRSYRESGAEEKRQVKWPLLGTTVALSGQLVIFILLRLPTMLGHSLISLGMAARIIGKALYLLIPISFAFAILKYRLMDIDVIIKKTVIYSILTGIIVALYFVLVVGVGSLVINLTGVESQWVTIASTLAIAAVFVPVRNRVQQVVDRRFFRKKYDYPTALNNLSREIAQAMELPAMLTLVAEHLQPALQNRSVVIFSKGTYDRAYVATAKVGLPDEVLGQLKLEADSTLLTMLDAPVEVHLQQLPEAERLTLRKAGSALVVPVKLKNELVGVISLGTKLSDEDYDAEDKEFLTAVAEQIATGVDRLRLREQERDFEKAREIQQGLLPTQIPQVSGYEIACAWQPARAVAGDYYDVIRLSDSALGICIADVVGKGMPAALLMSNLQAIVRAMASEEMPPKQLCAKVNQVISNNVTPGKFITFFYGALNTRNKKLVYTNAGHNHPILFHQDGTWVELKAGGLPLGLFREGTYEQGNVEVQSGDRLVLFTDGVTEAMNAEGEEFGEKRLIELVANNPQLGAAELQKTIMEAVTEFSGGDFQDDVTLITISVE